MLRPNADALSLSHRVLRILVVLNWLFGAAILVLLIWTVAAPAWVTRALGLGNDPGVLIGGRFIMVIGIAGAAVSNVILSRLLQMVATVRAGDPFVTANAARLKTIAWAVLGLELSRVVVAGIAKIISTPTVEIDMGLDLSVTPWLAVLLLFVLARVFDYGARMREDLDGTV